MTGQPTLTTLTYHSLLLWRLVIAGMPPEERPGGQRRDLTLTGIRRGLRHHQVDELLAAHPGHTIDEAVAIELAPLMAAGVITPYHARRAGRDIVRVRPRRTPPPSTSKGA